MLLIQQGIQMTGEAFYEKLGDWKPLYSWKDGIKDATDDHLKSKEK
ncbi:MAG: hypothetical protein HGN29_05620 [Asgard group archaeon]|nr:hypothetical protein [Asgard group archaeon]